MPCFASLATRLHWLVVAAVLCLSGCTDIVRYRTMPGLPGSAQCSADTGPDRCDSQSTERHPRYTMHVVEFDDEGWPLDKRREGDPPEGPTQLDSAISQINAEVAKAKSCVRLFVFVHGWQHDASSDDPDVDKFRIFLDKVSKRSRPKRAEGASESVGPIQDKSAGSLATTAAADGDGDAQVVGLYVGWRGRSLEGWPFEYASFWDRKNTAERVAQGSVRELFGRLGQVVDAYRPPATDAKKPPSRLHVYVIGHSFGASVVFRALSQTLIDSFAAGLDKSTDTAALSISRSFDMVVLVNPAIEAARFDPVFRAATKQAARCGTPAGCAPPPYQAPVLAIFTSEGDWATELAFPVGATLGNIFEKATSPEQSRAIHKTIGWDADYVTHELRPGTCTSNADRLPFEGPPGNLRYRPPGWTWCFDDDKTGLLALTQVPSMPGKTSTATTYNGPLWNVRVSSEIMANHNDIWNDKFRGVLLHFFADSDTNPVMLDTASAAPPPN